MDVISISYISSFLTSVACFDENNAGIAIALKPVTSSNGKVYYELETMLPRNLAWHYAHEHPSIALVDVLLALTTPILCKNFDSPIDWDCFADIIDGHTWEVHYEA